MTPALVADSPPDGTPFHTLNRPLVLYLQQRWTVFLFSQGESSRAAASRPASFQPRISISLGRATSVDC